MDLSQLHFMSLPEVFIDVVTWKKKMYYEGQGFNYLISFSI